MAALIPIKPMTPRATLTLSWLLVWTLVAFIWSFAEAIWFFIIVDVLLTLAVMRFGFWRALLPALGALIGAMAGAIALYFWAELNPLTVQRLILSAPGVSTEMVARISYDLANEPDFMSVARTMIWGGFTGDPLKVFASTAYGAGLTPLTAFLLPAALARATRFAVILCLAGLIRAVLFKRLRRVGLIRLTLFIWVVFYLWFGYVFWDMA